MAACTSLPCASRSRSLAGASSALAAASAPASAAWAALAAASSRARSVAAWRCLQVGLDARGLVLQQLGADHDADPQRHRLRAGRLRHHVVDAGEVGARGQRVGAVPVAVAETQDAPGRRVRLGLARRPPALAHRLQLPAEGDAVERHRQQIHHHAVDRPAGGAGEDRLGRDRALDNLDLVAVAPQQRGQRPRLAGLARALAPAAHQHDDGAAEQPDAVGQPGDARTGCGAVDGPGAGALAQQRPDPQHDQRLLGRFRHVGVGAALQPLPLGAGLRGLGQDQHRDGAGAHVEAQRAGQVAAAHARQVVVRDHQVGQRPVQPLQRRLGAGGALDLEAVPFQRAADLQRLGVGILDQQQLAALQRRPRTAHASACAPAHARLAGSICSSRGAITSSGRLAQDPPSRIAAPGMP